jgi:hypothetical protein
MKIEFTSPLVTSMSGWSRNCRVNGKEYQVSMRRGKSVRIPYKPRGQNRGWQWHASVYSGGRCIWSDRVPGSLGVKGILKEANTYVEIFPDNEPVTIPEGSAAR